MLSVRMRFILDQMRIPDSLDLHCLEERHLPAGIKLSLARSMHVRRRKRTRLGILKQALSVANSKVQTPSACKLDMTTRLPIQAL